MDDKLQEVRRDIELTRAALGEKIDRLTNKVETAKNTTLNPAYHVKTRPWPTLGITVALGCLVGRYMKARLVNSAARRNGIPPRPSIVREVARNTSSSAANVVGLLVADFLRDFINERRKRRQERRSSS